jgi:hypothetical protein
MGDNNNTTIDVVPNTLLQRKRKGSNLSTNSQVVTVESKELIEYIFNKQNHGETNKPE